MIRPAHVGLFVLMGVVMIAWMVVLVSGVGALVVTAAAAIVFRNGSVLRSTSNKH